MHKVAGDGSERSAPGSTLFFLILSRFPFSQMPFRGQSHGRVGLLLIDSDLLELRKRHIWSETGSFRQNVQNGSFLDLLLSFMFMSIEAKRVQNVSECLFWCQKSDFFLI